jgi:hypothetical protein
LQRRRSRSGRDTARDLVHECRLTNVPWTDQHDARASRRRQRFEDPLHQLVAAVEASAVPAGEIDGEFLENSILRGVGLDRRGNARCLDV